MHLAPLIQDLAVILGVAGLMSLIFQRIKQPVVLGYILAGMIVGPHTPPFQMVMDLSGIQTWAELGVIFLMFSLGLEFSFRKLARVGASAGITAGAEVLFFLPVGYATGKFFGWSSMDSIFLGAMLAISSTTIIIKALDELKLKTHRFAELIFGVLIVEDLIAILLLVGLTTIATHDSVSALSLLTAAAKLILVVGGWFIVGYFVVPRFIKYIGRVGNNEILTLLSLGLCLGLVVFASHFHYSTALGAFIMGSILAESPLIHRIEERMESLRDLFGAIFFVSIGMLIDPRILWEQKGVIAILCAVTIFGKIFSTGLGALLAGQTFKTSVKVGFGLAQIGEFSFIIAGLGVTLHATSDFLYPVAVAVSLVTTFTTPYLIRLSGPLSEWLEKNLSKKLINLLNRYAKWHETRGKSGEKREKFFRLLSRWFINGLTISIIFVSCSELLIPYLKTFSPMSNILLQAMSWVIAVALSSPFIWGMLFSFKDYNAENSNQDSRSTKFLLLVFQILTLIWIAALSLEFFPARYVGIGTGAALSIGIGLFHRRLGESYHWFESRFLSAFEPNRSEDHWASDLRKLAPWDAHLVRIQIHPNAIYSGKSLIETQLRSKYGINVVAIRRGLESLIAPKPTERLFPHDEILVLGTDECIETVRSYLTDPSATSLSHATLTGYELKQIEFHSNSHFTPGVSIRNSGIRERYGAIVVGVERDGKHMMNPDSDMPLENDMVLWLVAPSENFDRLQNDLQGIHRQIT